MIGIGIIGCGKITQVRHLPEYKANPEVKIIGLFDLNYERAKALAAEYGATAYRSLDKLLADERIEAVSVCTANYNHCEATVKALKAGKHVLCEKPMATTIEECEQMVRAAAENGRKLMIGMNQRLAKAHIRAKRLIDQGEIGRVLTFRTIFGHSGPENWSVDPGKGTWFFDKKRAAMGVMADLGIHKTDLIQYLVGEKIVAVTAKLSTIDKTDLVGTPISVDDNAVCVYEMKGGAVGTMISSWTYYGEEDNSTVIIGTKGTMRIYDSGKYPVEIRNTDHEKIMVNVEAIQTNDNQTKSGVIDAFVRCVMADEEPPISGRNVLAAMRVVFAAIRSSEEGRRIEIPENR
ncbi:MAG: Gfo/Idh/MocA family oxidoreductase [Bacteroidales bacterium]|nr:Gfo/Idh/MocA family oxidoreductase [Bacteroidales bacterium]